jgi:hypothetical protein
MGIVPSLFDLLPHHGFVPRFARDAVFAIVTIVDPDEVLIHGRFRGNGFGIFVSEMHDLKAALAGSVLGPGRAGSVPI